MFRPASPRSIALRFSVLCFGVLCLVSPAVAEKDADLKPRLATPGSVVLEQSFDQPLAKPMTPVKGEWKTDEGVLVAKELAADKHAAVLNCQTPNRNSIVRFSFQLGEQTKGFNFSLNHKGGHLFRVAVAPQRLTVTLDKDKKDPQSKPLALGSAKGQFEPGKWYTLQVEMLGDQVVAQADNGAVVQASHAKLDTDKPNYRFVMRGEGLRLDDLKVWRAE